MFFAFAVFFIAVFLFNLKIVVCTVVIEDLIAAFPKEMAVFIGFRLDKIALISQNIKCPVDVMELIRRLFQKFGSRLIRRAFA